MKEKQENFTGERIMKEKPKNFTDEFKRFTRKEYLFRKFLIIVLGFTSIGLSLYISVFEDTIYSWIVVFILIKVSVDCLQVIYEATEEKYE